MGHKVNPVGMRIGVIRDWESRWYAENDYGTLVNEDDKLRKFLFKELKAAYVSRIEIERSKNRVDIIIRTARPGVIIGTNGESVELLKKKLEKMVDGKSVYIKVVEVANPDLDANLVARSIAEQLENRASFRTVQKKAIQKTMRAGAKGINCESTVMVNGGRTIVIATGSNGYEDGDVKRAKAIKCDSAYVQNGGEVRAYSKTSEAIESKGTIDINGGTVCAVSSDDAINSASTFTISGGRVMGYSTGNDGLDANGNMYIKGGNIVAFGASGAETAIDIGDQYKLYITGGNIFGIGGRIDANLGSTTQGIVSTSGSVTANGTVSVSDGSSTLFTFTMPPYSYNQYGSSTGSATTRSNYGGGTTTNYYDQYGGSTGSATTRSNYGGGYTTNYYDQYGGSTGSATTRSNYGGGTTTNYYDQYGSSIGSSTTRSNYGGGTTTTYYDQYGNSLGTSYGR